MNLFIYRYVVLMNGKKIALLAIIFALPACFFLFDLHQYLSLDYLKARQHDINACYQEHPVRTALIFFSVYVLVTSASLPGGGIMTIAGGAIFGLVSGSLLVSFASTIGATIAFLIARYLFRDAVQLKFHKQLQLINRGMEKEGGLYLFSVRLVPAFPSFIINIVMALTPIKTITFAWVSQLGMLIPTIIFVNAGIQLGQIESAGDILSPRLIFSFVLLGLFPLLAKTVMSAVRGKPDLGGKLEVDSDA